MSRNLLSRYIWIIDTIRRYGAITREKLNELWIASPYSEGNPLPRRTFYNYRTAIEELFNINIECNSATYEYYIDSSDSHNESVTDWLLNSAAMSNVLANVSDVSDRIFLEDVPSARLYLSQVISALRESHTLRFTYRPYTRLNPSRDVIIEPYFLKIFRQRWYVAFFAACDRFNLFAVTPFQVRDILPVIPFFVINDFGKPVHFEFLVFWRMGIVMSPLSEGDVSADKQDEPAVHLIKVLNYI